MFDTLLFFSIALIIGFIGLITCADRFVSGSASLAQQWHISPLVIGLTIVSLGTSAPELFVSATAAIDGSPDIAVGNGIGSNIANIGLVLGCTALVAGIYLPANLIRNQIPILLAISLLAGVLLYDADLSRLDSIAMLALLAGYLFYTARSSGDNPIDIEITNSNQLSALSAWTRLIIGLAGLVIFSKLLVWGAQGLAAGFGVSELVIGLTVIAVGTSLPELATTMIGALKGEKDIAIGNILGSNIFNLLGVIGLAGIIKPTSFSPEVFSRDYFSMIMLTVLLCLAYLPLLWSNAQLKISRAGGAILLLCYIMYYLWVF